MIRCVAAAVMAMTAVSVHAESLRADAALEIVGGVGTTVITDVFERIEFGLSDLPPPITRAMTGAALRRDLRVGAGEPGFVASISTIEITETAATDALRCTARSRGPCNNLVLAQYN
jgi:hypothetical protein